MSNLAIKDTHAVIKMLQSKGASKELAEGVVEALQSATLADDPATKVDLKVATADLEAKLYRALITTSLAVIGTVLAGTAVILQVFFSS